MEIEFRFENFEIFKKGEKILRYRSCLTNKSIQGMKKKIQNVIQP